ncbi:hypothetical protein F4819DRAFT_487750 [Hypoxylon fuscum]|nr:hypothetical protein F4819DRAFT_487750 [Hypoxylon fuscum]
MSIENGIANAGAECNDDYLRQMVMVQNVQHLEESLNGLGQIRDVQEDEIDQLNEEAEKLKEKLRHKHNGPSASLTDKQLYRSLRNIGKHDIATKLLESARKLDRLQAQDRKWLYMFESHKTQHSSTSNDEEVMKNFIHRAARNRITVSHPRDISRIQGHA